MPYKQLKDLPEQVKKALPNHAKEIYRASYNNAWDVYKDPADRKGNNTREETAHSVAWAAVEQKYKKDKKGNWVKKNDS